MHETTTPDHLAGLLVRPVLSMDEAATVVGCSLSHIRRAVASGDLPHRRLGRRIFIPTADLLALVGAA